MSESERVMEPNSVSTGSLSGGVGKAVKSSGIEVKSCFIGE